MDNYMNECVGEEGLHEFFRTQIANEFLLIKTKANLFKYVFNNLFMAPLICFLRLQCQQSNRLNRLTAGSWSGSVGRSNDGSKVSLWPTTSLQKQNEKKVFILSSAKGKKGSENESESAAMRLKRHLPHVTWPLINGPIWQIVPRSSMERGPQNNKRRSRRRNKRF